MTSTVKTKALLTVV